MNENLHPEMATQSEANSGTAVGAFLRASRLRRGEDLAEVASQLRIRNVYLEAIEDGRFEELPGNTYVVGFIRTYAEYLGLDGTRVVERYRDEITSDDGGQSLTFPTVVSENGIPRGAAVMVGLLVVAVGYGAWFFLNSADHFQATAVAPVPVQIERAAGSAVAGPPASSQVTLRAAEPSQPASAVAATAEPSSPAPAPAATETPAPVQAVADERAAPPPEQPQDRNALDKIAETIAAAPAEDVRPPVTPELTPEATPEINPSPAPATRNPPADIQPKPVQAAATEPEAQPEPAAPSNGAPEPAVETPAATVAATPAPEPTPEPAPEPAATAASEPAAPEQLAALPSASDARQGLEQTTGRQAAAATDSTATAALSPQPAPTPAPEATSTPEPAPAATPEPAPAATPEPAPAAPQIVIRAVIDSWIQVRDMEANQLVTTKLLRSGDTYEVPARRGLSLLTGNAGALEIEVDGKLVPSIGPVGTVRRNVALDAEKLSSGTAITQ